MLMENKVNCVIMASDFDLNLKNVDKNIKSVIQQNLVIRKQQ